MARICIKKIILISSLSLLTGCGASQVMTRQDYYTISTGTSSQEVIEKYGQPYSIRNKRDGSQEYLYIERINAGGATAQKNNYILVIKNGQVVSKRMNYELPSAYDEIYDEDPNDVPN